MPIAPLEKFGLGGLMTDQPREALDLQYFDDGLNLRPIDGAVSGVFDFDLTDTRIRLFQNISDGADYTTNVPSMKPYDIAQWTRAGTEYLDIIAVGLDSSDNGIIYITGKDADPAVITSCNFVYPFTYDPINGFNTFIFNEVAIVNPTTTGPMYSFDRENFYSLPNWFGEPIGGLLTAVSQYTVYSVANVVDDDWSSLGGSKCCSW